MMRLTRQICMQFGPVFQRGSLSKHNPASAGWNAEQAVDPNFAIE